MTLVAVAALAACRHDDVATDAGQEAGAPLSCMGDTVCDGTAIRACRMGYAAEVLQDCAPESCSLGRCVSSACAAAEQNRATFIGCTFYTFDLPNVMSDEAIPTSVLVTNPGQTSAHVALERRDPTMATATAGWASAATMIVPPLQSGRLQLPVDQPQGGGLVPRGAYRLTSDQPVSAAHIQSDDSTPGGSTSSGGTLLLPQHVLGPRYRAITYPQVATPELQDTPGARGGAGQVVIVGAADGTHVTITPSAFADLAPGGGVPPPGPDGTLRLILDEGDLFILYSNRDGADLSGSEIAADRPLAVFSGNISTTYGITATGVSSPDLAHEQLLPVSAWGTSYVGAQLRPQTGVCDPLLTPPGSSLWTFVADQDGTTVRLTDASGAAVAPDRTIGAGETFHVAAVGDFTVVATLPIEIMQGMDCEPTLSSAVPTSNLLSELTFAVLPNFATEAAIVRATGDATFIDGVRVPDDATIEPAGNGFEVVRLPIDPCAPAEGVCTHHLEGRFGFTMRGMDVLTSWALTAPSWCSDSATGNCIK
jgi:hypothetical protein